MKNPLLIPFLAVLLTVFVVGFISKQEQNTDEKLFREYLQGFKQAKLPLKVKANSHPFDLKRIITKKFDAFFVEGYMKPYKMSRSRQQMYCEYGYTILDNDSIVAVLCNSITERVSYRKHLVVYNKKGVILDCKTLAYEWEERTLTTNIKKDFSFYAKEFSRKDKKDKWKLTETENFVITSAGKIEPKP